MRHRGGRRRSRLGRALLARLVFIVTEVANLPFDTDKVRKPAADSIVLSTAGIKRLAGRSFATRWLTIADRAAPHHRSYDSVDSTGRHD